MGARPAGPRRQSQVLNLLLELQEERKLSYLFIAHDLAVVKHISDRVAVMYLGKIVEMSDAETIYQSPKHAYTKALLDAIPEPDPARANKHQPLPLPIGKGAPRSKTSHFKKIPAAKRYGGNAD